MKKRLLSAVLLVIMICMIGVSAQAASEKEWKPDFTFTTVDTTGAEWTDEAFADAKLTMINFWAYWCPPCVKELPDLQKLSEDYAEKGFQLLGVSEKDYEKDNIKTMEELKLTYPTLQMTDEIFEHMNTGYVPTTIFVDAEGHLIGEVYVGGRSYADWAEIIDELLPEES